MLLLLLVTDAGGVVVVTSTAAGTLRAITAAGSLTLLSDDFFAGVVAFLKADPALVAAFGQAAATPKFHPDFAPPGVDLPHLVYVEVASGTQYVSHDTSIEFGNFQATVTAAGKSQARALSFLLWTALDDAPIRFPTGLLMRLLHGNSFSQALRERGPDGEPVQYQQITEFQYQVSRPRVPRA